MSPFGSSNSNKPNHRWRLVVPLFGIFTIVAIAASLLYVSQVFERRRQEQRLISETLWAEQALSCEFSRLATACSLWAHRGRRRPFRGVLTAPVRRCGSLAGESFSRTASLYPPQSDGDRLTSHADIYALRCVRCICVTATTFRTTPGISVLQCRVRSTLRRHDARGGGFVEQAAGEHHTGGSPTRHGSAWIPQASDRGPRPERLRKRHLSSQNCDSTD
jgi:hypothetical protein